MGPGSGTRIRVGQRAVSAADPGVEAKAADEMLIQREQVERGLSSGDFLS